MNLIVKYEKYATAHSEFVVFVNNTVLDKNYDALNRHVETLFNTRVSVQKVLDRYKSLMTGWIKSENIPTSKCIEVFKDLKTFYSLITESNTFSDDITSLIEMENTLMYKVHDQANELYKQCMKVDTCTCCDNETD